MLSFLCLRTASLVACTIDRFIASRGMALLVHHEWPAARLDAWRDEQEALTVQCWRFEFIRDGREQRAVTA